MQALNISLSPEMFLSLEAASRDMHLSIEIAAVHLLKDALKKKKTETVRILQPDRVERSVHPDNESLHEIIHRQDAEILWLRDHITRISTLTPTTHVIRHEYSTCGVSHLAEQPTVSSTSAHTLEDSQKPGEDPAITSPAVSVDDVQYTPGPGESGKLEDLISPSMNGGDAGLSEMGRVPGRTLRDSIGGVREELEYSVHEAAAIAGESESVILEYVMDGFLPATKDGTSYHIKGNDLRRYMLSK